MAAMMAPSILIVDDEFAQREVLSYNLQSEGFEVSTASDGEEALVIISEIEPDIILLDWMMPNMSGLELCRRLRAKPKTSNIPIIMLSARSEEVDKVRGLETGADDYMVKPYSIMELVARVRNQLRRVRASTVATLLEYEDICLDTERYRVTRNGAEVKLGPTELRLLSTFLEKPGRVWSRDQLLNRVWGRDIYVDTRTVDVHVGRLRKALTKNGDTDLIRTVRGAGYALG